MRVLDWFLNKVGLCRLSYAEEWETTFYASRENAAQSVQVRDKINRGLIREIDCLKFLLEEAKNK